MPDKKPAPEPYKVEPYVDKNGDTIPLDHFDNDPAPPRDGLEDDPLFKRFAKHVADHKPK